MWHSDLSECRARVFVSWTIRTPLISFPIPLLLELRDFGVRVDERPEHLVKRPHDWSLYLWKVRKHAPSSSAIVGPPLLALRTALATSGWAYHQHGAVHADD